MSNLQVVNEILELGRDGPRTIFEMSSRIAQGFSLKTLRVVAGKVAPEDPKFVYQVVPKGTYKRRTIRRDSLSANESERMMRVVDAYAAACKVFGDETLAREFMNKPHPIFDRQTPRGVALQNHTGLQAVLDVLGRGANGSAA